MYSSRSPQSGAVLASIASGPIFLFSTALATAYMQLPGTVHVRPGEFAQLLLLAIPAILVGFTLSLLPNLIAARILILTGAVFEPARGRIAWIAAGALLGTAVGWATGAFHEPAFGFGVVFTSISCAAICRRHVSWG